MSKKLSIAESIIIELLDGTVYPEDIVRNTGMSLERATAIMHYRKHLNNMLEGDYVIRLPEEWVSVHGQDKV